MDPPSEMETDDLDDLLDLTEEEIRELLDFSGGDSHPPPPSSTPPPPPPPPPSPLPQKASSQQAGPSRPPERVPGSDSAVPIEVPASPDPDELVMSFSKEDIQELVSIIEEDDVGEEGNNSQPVGDNEVMVDPDPVFIQFVPGQLDCSECKPLRELLHENDHRKLFFVIHGKQGGFAHAICDIAYVGAPLRRELSYLDLRGRTHEWVKNVISRCITALRADTSGTLQDAMSSFYDALFSNLGSSEVDHKIDQYLNVPATVVESETFRYHTVPSSVPLQVSEPDRNVDNLEDLNQILGMSSSSDAQRAGNGHPPILESSHVAGFEAANGLSDGNDAPSDPSNMLQAAQGFAPETELTNPNTREAGRGPSNAAARSSSQQRTGGPAPRTGLARQRERTANMKLHELIPLLHMPMSMAASKLNVCSTALKHICRRNGLPKWPSRQINAINSKIVKLEAEAANARRPGRLLEIKDEVYKLRLDRMNIYREVMAALPGALQGN